MSVNLTKASLSEPRRRLLDLMQQLGFGRVEGLTVRNGEPVLEPSPRVIREHKFGGENGPRPERAAADFALKTQLVELFKAFDEFQDAAIAVLEVKHGLPFRMMVEERRST
jgi:hypothetical protein